jgi:hypothetical protein
VLKEFAGLSNELMSLQDIRRHDIQHNDTQQNDTQYNDIQHNSKKIATLSIMALFYAECLLC